jgi:hypothetical protein
MDIVFILAVYFGKLKWLYDFYDVTCWEMCKVMC